MMSFEGLSACRMLVDLSCLRSILLATVYVSNNVDLNHELDGRVLADERLEAQEDVCRT